LLIEPPACCNTPAWASIDDELAALLSVEVADAAADTGGPPGGAAPEADPPRALVVPSIVRRGCATQSEGCCVLLCAALCLSGPTVSHTLDFFLASVQLVAGERGGMKTTGHESACDGTLSPRAPRGHCCGGELADYNCPAPGKLTLTKKEIEDWVDVGCRKR